MNFYRPGPPTTFARIPLGVEGIETTMQLMRRLVRGDPALQSGKHDPGIRQIADGLVGEQGAQCPQGDYSCEVAALHAFVRDHIRYVGDIAEVETLQTPRRTLEQGSGDCDDKSTLLATLLETIGHKTRFVAGAYHQPGFYEHVWVETRIGRGWYPLETTRPVPPGWNPRARMVGPPLVAHN